MRLDEIKEVALICGHGSPLPQDNAGQADLLPPETDGATVPAFSDKRFVDAPGALVADRPEQRPSLAVAMAGRLEAVVHASPYPSHEAFCRSQALDRGHQAVSVLARAPVVMLVAIYRVYGVQDTSARCGQPDTAS